MTWEITIPKRIRNYKALAKLNKGQELKNGWHTHVTQHTSQYNKTRTAFRLLTQRQYANGI